MTILITSFTLDPISSIFEVSEMFKQVKFHVLTWATMKRVALA